MIRNNEEMYNQISEWVLDLTSKKLDYLRFMSFDKSPRDFVQLESYSKYKQRENEKMTEKATQQREKDLSNIERWLSDEKKQAIWN